MKKILNETETNCYLSSIKIFFMIIKYKSLSKKEINYKFLIIRKKLEIFITLNQNISTYTFSISIQIFSTFNYKLLYAILPATTRSLFHTHSYLNKTFTYAYPHIYTISF